MILVPAPLQLGAIVLAAGASTRMGQPKPLIRWQGATFLERVVASVAGAGCEPRLVVEGATRLPRLAGTRVVVNRNWPMGQLSSLQAALRSLPRYALDVSGVLVVGVDHPTVRPATVAALAEAWRGHPCRLWQPRHDGCSGHPIIYPSDLFDALLELSPGSSARDLVRSEAVQGRRSMLDVDDPGVVRNVDTPADLRWLGA